MDIDQIISEKISEQVALTLEARLTEIVSVVVDQLSPPKYVNYGRFLSTKQAMIYTGFKSVNGFNQMVKMKGIEAIRINNRVLRYDRNELDKINVQQALKGYVNSL